MGKTTTWNRGQVFVLSRGFQVAADRGFLSWGDSWVSSQFIIALSWDEQMRDEKIHTAVRIIDWNSFKKSQCFKEMLKGGVSSLGHCKGNLMYKIKINVTFNLKCKICRFTYMKSWNVIPWRTNPCVQYWQNPTKRNAWKLNRPSRFEMQISDSLDFAIWSFQLLRVLQV